MLIAISAAHGRHAVTRAWAEHTASLGFDAVVVSVTEGDHENLQTCLDHGFFPISMDNDPLGAKFNAAASVAMAKGASKVMILPSDDFASPQWMEAARDTDHDYIYPYTCGIVDAHTQQAYIIRKISFGTLRYGAGRVVSRKVLDKVNGELWPENINKGLDSASHARIERAGFNVQVVAVGGVPITDVKTADNLWPFNTWRNSGDPIHIDAALHMVSPEVREQINALMT